ncbi:MAG: hypothetical protein ACW986_19840, partial [Promethearchaeota archaeon]
MKILKISSKRTRALAKQMLGDMYTEELWNTLLSLDLTPTQKHLPVLARFLKQNVSMTDLVKVYRIFENSKARNVDLYQFKKFDEFSRFALQHKSKLSEYYDYLSRVDKTEANSHISSLLRLMNDGGVNLAQISYYYQTFMDSDLSEDKDFNDYVHFSELETDVDGLGGIMLDDLEDEPVPPIYTDSNLSVYLGDSKRACTDLTQGYTFCIGRPEPASNMYASYRLRGKTFYFVRFHDAHEENPYIVVHINSDGSLQWTNSRNTGDISISKDNLLSMFPELEVLFKNDILPYIPLTRNESESLRAIKDKVNDKAFQAFSYDLKTQYVEYGHKLTNYQISLLDKDQLNLFLTILIASGKWLTKDEYELFGANLQRRYRNKKLPDVKKLVDENKKLQDGQLFILDNTELGEEYYNRVLRGNADIDEWEKSFIVRNGWLEQHYDSVKRKIKNRIKEDIRLRAGELNAIKGTELEGEYIKGHIIETLLFNADTDLFDTEIDFIKGTIAQDHFCKTILPQKMQIGIHLKEREIELVQGTKYEEIYINWLKGKILDTKNDTELPVKLRLNDADLKLIHGTEVHALYIKRSLETGATTSGSEVEDIKELDEKYQMGLIQDLIERQLVNWTWKLHPAHKALIQGTKYEDQYWNSVDAEIRRQITQGRVRDFFYQDRIHANPDKFDSAVMRKILDKFSRRRARISDLEPFEKKVAKRNSQQILSALMPALKPFIHNPNAEIIKIAQEWDTGLYAGFGMGKEPVSEGIAKLYKEDMAKEDSKIRESIRDLFQQPDLEDQFVYGFTQLSKIQQNFRHFVPEEHEEFMREIMNDGYELMRSSLIQHLNKDRGDKPKSTLTAPFLGTLGKYHKKLFHDPEVIHAFRKNAEQSLTSSEIKYQQETDRISWVKSLEEVTGLEIATPELKNKSYPMALSHIRGKYPSADFNDWDFHFIDKFYNGRLTKDLPKIQKDTSDSAMYHINTYLGKGYDRIHLSYANVIYRIFKRYKDVLQNDPAFNNLMENNKQKWIKSAVEMFSYGQEDSLEDFVTHIDFFKRISGEIYREIQKTIEDEVTGTLVDKDELYRNLNRVLGIVDNENNALDFFLSGEYDYEGLESEKHRKMIEKVLEDPVARDRALVSYHPKMLAAFQSGDLDFIKEMNSLLHYDQRDEFLKDAYINAKRWILKLFQHIGQGQFVDNGITQQLSENDLDQFSYLND